MGGEVGAAATGRATLTLDVQRAAALAPPNDTTRTPLSLSEAAAPPSETTDLETPAASRDAGLDQGFLSGPPLNITQADRGELIRRLDAVEAGLQEVIPTLEAIKAALRERPQIGHNNPPESTDLLPLDTSDVQLTTSAVSVARVEIGTEHPRPDVLRLSGLALQQVAFRLGQWLAIKSDGFAGAFAKSAGTEAGKRFVQGGALVAFYPALHKLIVDLGAVATQILQTFGH
jgi:hypothetical protein